MATQTVASSDQIPTTHEKVEEEKASEDFGDSLPKGSVEEVLESEDSASLATPSESEGVVDYKKIEPPVEKAADTPAPDAPITENPKVETEIIPDSETTDTPTHVNDGVESPAAVHSLIEPVVREAPKEAAIETTETGKVEAPLSSVEAIEKLEEKVEATSDKGSVASGVPLADESKVENESIPDSHTPNIPKQDTLEAEAPKEAAVDIIEVGQVEQPKIVDAPLSSVEAIEKLEEPLEVASEKGLVETVEAIEKLEEPLEATAGKGSVASGVSLVAESNVENESIPDSQTPNIPKQVADVVERSVEAPKEAAVDIIEVVDAPLSSVEAIEKPEEPLEVTSEKGSVETVVKETKDLEPESLELPKKHEEVVPEKSVEEEPEETKLAEEEKKHEEVVLEKGVEDEKMKDEGSSVDKVEETTVKDDKPGLIEAPIEPTLPDVIEKIASEDRQEEVSVVNVVENVAKEASVETEKENVIPDNSTQPIEEEQKEELSAVDVVEKVVEKAAAQLVTVGGKEVETEKNEKNELSAVDVVEKVVEKAAAELETVGEKEVKTEEDGKNLITDIQPVIERVAEEAVAKLEKVEEDNEKKDVITEESSPQIEEVQEKESDAVNMVEKLAEEAAVEVEKAGVENETEEVKFKDNEKKYVTNEVVERSLEGAGKEKKYVTTVENVAAEHIKDETPAEVETKKDGTVEEKQSDTEVKGDADKLEKMEDEVAKPGENVEPAPPAKDLPQEVAVKPSQKQSNTILSKVKQSLVKAKKAITGKSPSSKTPASGTKEEIKVK